MKIMHINNYDVYSLCPRVMSLLTHGHQRVLEICRYGLHNLDFSAFLFSVPVLLFCHLTNSDQSKRILSLDRRTRFSAFVMG